MKTFREFIENPLAKHLIRQKSSRPRKIKINPKEVPLKKNKPKFTSIDNVKRKVNANKGEKTFLDIDIHPAKSNDKKKFYKSPAETMDGEDVVIL